MLDNTINHSLIESSWEVIIMFATAFLLGFLLRHFIQPTKRDCDCGQCTVCVAALDDLVVAEDEYIAPDTGPTMKEVFGKTFKSTNLKIVEGIGPKIEKLLKADDIMDWADLAECSVSRLEDVLYRAGDRYAMHNPQTWPHQAALARDEQWQELKDLQEELHGGT